MSELFEELRALIDCDYISDLRDTANRGKIKTAVETLDPNLFSLSDWKALIEYVVGSTDEPSSCEDARQILTSALTRSR